MNEDDRLVSTGPAARALGVDRSTLWRWYTTGLVKPDQITAGRQLRWNVALLRHQVAAVVAQEEAVPEAATKPEPQPVVAAIVTSPLGVLLGRRHDGKPPWTFIAGEIEPGESQVDAAVREVKEETGLLVRAADLEIGRRVHPKTGRLMIYLACQPTEGTNIYVGDPDELAEVRWASLTEADELLPGLFEPVRNHLVKQLAG